MVLFPFSLISTILLILSSSTFTAISTDIISLIVIHYEAVY
jgi:hypothetical protein